ncbi:MAG: sensor histidine kinase [Gemmatimonadales bacterium]
MRLSDFIRKNREEIMSEWQAFAETCHPASGSMNFEALRDHASEMLSVIARDLDTPQGGHEQAEKSMGNAKPTGSTEETAAEKHGTDRAESGFSIDQMVAEYRALRASVIRLWSKSEGRAESTDLEDLIRFNEAIDQSLAESIARYTGELNNSKDMFLAILGHDLRTPLGAILMSSEFMLDTADLKEPHIALAARIASSARRMNQMIGALLDFTRSRLGGGIPIERGEMNLGKAVHEVVDELKAAYPDRDVTVDARGADEGNWDCARVSQVFSNLIANALEHGSSQPITVVVGGDAEEATVAIHNRGISIPPDQVSGLFNPMKTSFPDSPKRSTKSSANLGLGLYIADRIVNAHKGRIDVESSDAAGTTFTVHLPRTGE